MKIQCFNVYSVACILFLSILVESNTQEQSQLLVRQVVGKSSHIIAKSLIQHQLESSGNFAFSPIGFSSLLASLYEGSSGATYKEIQKVLELPENIEHIRNAYDQVLKTFSSSNPLLAPQFKTWLYIYKNNSVNEEFKQCIETYYNVEVKEISRFNDHESESSIEVGASKEKPQELLFPDEDTKEKGSFMRLRDEIVKAEENIQEESQKVKLKYLGADVPGDSLNIFKVMRSFLPIKREKSTSNTEDDVLSGLSGNSILGKKGKNADGDDEYESKMLLFNGLYFRGNWKYPFEKKKLDSSGIFNNLNSGKTQITMMKNQGIFKVGTVKSLGSEAIEIPYENERYSLLIVMPLKGEGGIKTLMKKFNESTLYEIDQHLQEQYIKLEIPQFKQETTSRAEKSLIKDGIISLFNKEAELSKITKDVKLHVDELVQHLSVRVDEGEISQNFLSATNLQRSALNEEFESFIVDRPFLFFVRDVIYDIVMVAGKIVEIPATKSFSFFKIKSK